MDPVQPLDRPRDAPSYKRRPTWLREPLQEVEKHAIPPSSFKESRRPHRFLGYVALVGHIIDLEYFTYEEAVE